MSWQYSRVAHDEVWVEDDEGNWTDCDECGQDIDLDYEGRVEGDEAFCNDCYNNLFGED